MMDINMANYFGLEESGAEIWRLFADPRTLDEVVVLLLERYDVDEATCRRETQALVDDLLARGLLVAEA